MRSISAGFSDVSTVLDSTVDGQLTPTMDSDVANLREASFSNEQMI